MSVRQSFTTIIPLVIVDGFANEPTDNDLPTGLKRENSWKLVCVSEIDGKLHGIWHCWALKVE